jgi:hypothetical protein
MRRAVLSIFVITAADASSVKLAPVFSDGFVLQDYFMFDSRSFVFGTAAPNEHVKLTLTHDANASITTMYESVADSSSKWIIQINPDYFNAVPSGQVANIGSRTLTLTVAGSSDSFRHTQKVNGIRFGDVFVCAGGIEMARPLSASSDGRALKSAPRNVRIFTGSEWVSAADSPDTLQTFSAACFFAAVSLPKLSRIYAANRTVALILAASTTTIDNWLPTHSTFQALLQPLAHYALRAIVWSHGAEELTSPSSFNASAYGDALTAVIAGTRVAWGQGDIAWISAQTSDVSSSSAAVELRRAQNKILPRRGGATALTGVVCTHDLGDLSSSLSKPGSDVKLGERLAAQILHVQWGWGDNMSTSPAAIAAGLQSIDWRGLSKCKNSTGDRSTGDTEWPLELHQEAQEGLEEQGGTINLPPPALSQTIAATPPMVSTVCEYSL